MTSVDVKMKDTVPSLDMSIVISHSDEEICSPRTPTYVPTSLSMSSIQPFDPSNFFVSVSPTKPSSLSHSLSSLPQPPPKPLSWVWECHLCHSRWSLAATRRCLDDGHYYCSGDADQPNLKRRKKRQSCSSEFDYAGWKEWSAWKGNAMTSSPNPVILKGCENCTYPSECTYARAATWQKSARAKEGMDKDCNQNATNNSNDELSRYYCNEKQNMQTLLATTSSQEMLQEQPQTQAKLTSNTRSDKKGAKFEDGRGNDKKNGGRRSSKKPSLSPIEEEFVKAETKGLGRGWADSSSIILDSNWGGNVATGTPRKIVW